MLSRALAASMCGALAMAAIACSAIRSESNAYATIEEARTAGAIDRGWVPAGLPPGSSDLREGHTPDGSQWGLFSFPPAQAESLRALLGSEITAEPPRCDPPGRLEWWPRLLRSPMDVEKVRGTGLRLYASADGRRTFAVNWGQGKGYYWRE